MEDKNTVQITQQYYDSSDADEFYFRIWGGEDIHIGIYEGNEPIKTASHRTVKQMAEMLSSLSSDKKVLDIGAGYGGAARYLARQYACSVVCLNLSTVENQRNRQINGSLELGNLISVIDGNFEKIPLEAQSIDFVWSEDAILHSSNRKKVFEEVDRVLKRGGEFIFTDPMMADDCPMDVLGPVLKRIHLPSMGSVKIYSEYAASLGWEKLSERLMPEQLTIHYSRVKEELLTRHEELKAYCSEPYLNQMLAGLQHWIDASTKSRLNWGILHFRKA